MRVLGMISGTSHDGVDTALVDFEGDGQSLRGTVLATGSTPYPDALRERLVASLPPGLVPMSEVCQLDTLLGQHFAAAAAAALQGTGAELVCSHGQTVYHWVDGRAALGTLQLGQPAWIAEAAGAPVLSDLRSADIAAGGQGAPLVPVLDTLLLGGLPGTTAALNLGGIANVTVLGSTRGVYAYDIGPANALIDQAVRHATGGREHYDSDGRYAGAGSVSAALLADLLAEPFYALPAPKSTGKERFHSGYLEPFRRRHPGLADEDVIATVTALTAEVVASAVRAAGADTVVASGGGTANPTLMGLLARALPGTAVRTTDEFGAPSDAKEAIAFALIGYLSAHGIPANVPSCTGATGPRVLGTLTAGTALPAQGALPAPTRLVLR